MDYKVTDTELTSVANAIRTKGSTSALLEWPDEFAQAVMDIPTGGGGSDDKFLIAMGASVGSIYDAEVSAVASYAMLSNLSITGLEMTNARIIYQDAFRMCSNLLEASLPMCESLYAQAFSQDIKLENVYLPNCLTIGNGAFNMCTRLVSVFAQSCVSIGSFAFASGSPINANFPVCENLAPSAFFQGGVITANFPVCSIIGRSTFTSCHGLQTVNFPKCKGIEERGFADCNVLKDVSFPECEYIGNYAFQGCSSISQAYFPVCSKISTATFRYCTKLESAVFLFSSLCILADTQVFAGTPMSASSYLGHFGSIYVPSSLVEEYKSAPNWSVYSDRITAYVE